MVKSVDLDLLVYIGGSSMSVQIFMVPDKYRIRGYSYSFSFLKKIIFYRYALELLHCCGEINKISRKHAYIMLTPLNPTFI